MISVITPTIRKEGLRTVLTALERQTYRDFEWLIGSPFDPKIKEAKWVRDNFEGGVWTLNRIYNKLIKKAKGDIIVSWQDFTFAGPDVLERFATHYDVNKKLLVGAVGNKYEEVYPRVRNELWRDPRMGGNMSFIGVPFTDIEWNLCSVPKQAIIDVGGFDEDLDFMGYGMDGYSVNDRINMLGTYDFALDQSIESYSLMHGRVDDWDDNNLIDGRYSEKRMEYVNNPKLIYLK